MLPHVVPRRTKCTACGCAIAGAIERLPDHDPRQQRGEGHSRSCPGWTSLRGRQSGCLGTLCRGQPACLHSPSPHKLPPERPGPIGPPKRKRCSQKPDAILTGSGCTGLSLRRSRVAAACRLRRSCRRDRGPVTLPRSGCPVHRSQHPAVVAQSLLPATPRGILRSRSAATPQPTPAKRRAIFINQCDTTLNRDPITPEPCLILRFTSDHPGKVCAEAHLIL